MYPPLQISLLTIVVHVLLEFGEKVNEILSHFTSPLDLAD